jgi:hypothetical protein
MIKLDIFKRKSGGFLMVGNANLSTMLESLPNSAKDIKVFMGNNGGFHSFDFFFFATFKSDVPINVAKKHDFLGCIGRHATFIPPAKYTSIVNEAEKFSAAIWNSVRN